MLSWYNIIEIMYSEDTIFTVPPPSKSSKRTTGKRWYKKWWGRLIIGFFVLFFAFIIAMAFYVGKVVILLRSGQITPQQLFSDNALPGQLGNMETLITLDDPSFGPKDAKVVIVEFSDFQCPFCQQAKDVVDEIKKSYGDRVLFIFRDFPLVADHPQALLAAVAGECAHEQGEFWQMHDRIFADQNNITEAVLKTYAEQMGLNVTQFNDCLRSGKYVDEIEQDLVEGYDAGVQATPTFFINGVKVSGAIPLNIFEQIIVSELSR